MNAQEALVLLRSLLALPDVPPNANPQTKPNADNPLETKTIVLAVMQAAGQDTTSWEPGDPCERWAEEFARAMASWGVVPTRAVMALFFPLATDPGDVDDFGDPDPSPDQTPRPGALSAVGQGFYGTTRGGQTFAISQVTIRNAGSTATLPFLPGQLVFEYSTAVPTPTRTDGGTPTYLSTAAPSVYVGIGGTLSLAPGATATIPVISQQIGSYGSAPQNKIDICVTQSFGNIVVTGSTTAVGQDREARPLYIGRCLLSADGHSPGGATRAYLRAMNTAKDGTILQRFDGSGPVNITQAYVSPSSATNAVTMYVGGLTGAAGVDATDLASAAANILALLVADPVTGEIHNADPIGVLPDTVTIGPSTSVALLPSGTPGPAICSNTTIDMTWSAKIRASKVPGGATPGTYTSPGTGTMAPVFTAVSSALGSYLYDLGIGGLDQVAGAGVVYTSDFAPVVRDAVAGFYDPLVTLPSASTTAIGVGASAAPGTITGTITVVAG